MNPPFTTDEILKSINKLKNNKAAGSDNLIGEQLKYGPRIIATIISEILNTMAETGEYPKEITTGILNPLQKPGKKEDLYQISDR